MLFKFQTTTTAYRVGSWELCTPYQGSALNRPHTPRRQCAYWSLLHPWHLDYASEVWAVVGVSISNAEKLEQVKLSATKIISGL